MNKPTLADYAIDLHVFNEDDRNNRKKLDERDLHVDSLGEASFIGYVIGIKASTGFAFSKPHSQALQAIRYPMHMTDFDSPTILQCTNAIVFCQNTTPTTASRAQAESMVLSVLFDVYPNDQFIQYLHVQIWMKHSDIIAHCRNWIDYLTQTQTKVLDRSIEID